jgi:threonine dehydrogenase-like Zn-dependent dehydrogenase
METALSLVMDSAPLVGERVLVLGQGIIGLLTTAILSKFPLHHVVTADRYALRRERSIEMGADLSLDPSMEQTQFKEESGLSRIKADVVIELSGSPDALELATHLTAPEGKIVVGSWYGTKPFSCHLGEDFHRQRLKIISSQVSRIDGRISGRWTKERRMEFVWKLLREVDPSRLISHRFTIESAPSAFKFLDEHGEQALQVLITYPED